MTFTSNANMASEIEAIKEKFVECGAPQDSDEYYITTNCLVNIKIIVFYAMKTNDGRFGSLKRMYANRRKNWN